MICYCVPVSKQKAVWPVIDSIYHSTTWQDMWLKIDLNSIKIDLDVFMMLCNTLCYHYGFWRHTKQRFLAFKKFLSLKKANPLSSIKMKKSTLFAVKKEVEQLDIEMYLNPIRRVPGRYAELRAWKSIQHILEKCQSKVKLKREGKQRDDGSR